MLHWRWGSKLPQQVAFRRVPRHRLNLAPKLLLAPRRHAELLEHRVYGGGVFGANAQRGRPHPAHALGLGSLDAGRPPVHGRAAADRGESHEQPAAAQCAHELAGSHDRGASHEHAWQLTFAERKQQMLFYPMPVLINIHIVLMICTKVYLLSIYL